MGILLVYDVTDEKSFGSEVTLLILNNNSTDFIVKMLEIGFQILSNMQAKE